jgi:hypothetical protein
MKKIFFLLLSLYQPAPPFPRANPRTRGLGATCPQGHVLQDKLPHVAEGRHVQPPLVKLPGLVMEAGLP